MQERDRVLFPSVKGARPELLNIPQKDIMVCVLFMSTHLSFIQMTSKRIDGVLHIKPSAKQGSS